MCVYYIEDTSVKFWPNSPLEAGGWVAKRPHQQVGGKIY